MEIRKRLPGGRVDDGARLVVRLAAGSVQCTEIAGERRRGRYKRGARGRILTNAGPLIAAEEEQLVADDTAAEGAAELIALQAVLPRREVVDRVHVAVANELEQVSVPRV